jgi:AraC family ethanolamine operon transcriptional activator
VIENGLDKGISVREVAIESNISRRTLEYAFRDRYDLSPKAFINSQRLVSVRRDLRSKAGDVPIVEIANQWGYWHMGQFARDYQNRFGELPSQTINL